MQTYIEANHDARRDAIARAPKLAAIAGRAQAGGAAVYLQTLLPTRCLPMPVRRNVDEFLYVVHGDVDVWVGDRHAALKAGMSIALPRGVAHRIANFTARPAKVLIVATPEAEVHVERRAGGRCSGAESVSAVVTPAGVHVAFG